MTVDYAVTFEFAIQPPLTVRGTVVADKTHTCAARAIREAAKAHPGVKWQSVVCLLTRTASQEAE